MQIEGRHMRTIWPEEPAAQGGSAVCVIDQTKLPFALEIVRLATVDAAARAICDMVVRGAPLIGATAAYGVALAMRANPDEASLDAAIAMLARTRPTAVNLRWALQRMARVLRPRPAEERAALAWREAARICDEDVEISRAIGAHGLGLIRAIADRVRRRVNILTHCNAGWLATVDYGTALAPIYMAHDAGLDVHVFVDETRPRNQGAALTAYELGAHGVPHTVVADNAGGHLMQRGQVDLCITGADRVAANGDAANKIGTYLKALAAADTGVPFYIALPSTTIDWTIADGLADIPIEERSADEVLCVSGIDDGGKVARVRVAAPGSAAANPAFDVTPARLLTGFITENGVIAATGEALRAAFPTLHAEAAP